MKKIAVVLMIGLLFPCMAFAQKGKQVKNVVKALQDGSGEVVLKMSGNQLYVVHPYGKTAVTGLSAGTLKKIESAVGSTEKYYELKKRINVIGQTNPEMAKNLAELAKENFELAEKTTNMFEEMAVPGKQRPEDVLGSLIVFLKENRRFPEAKVFDGQGNEITDASKFTAKQEKEVLLRKNVDRVLSEYPQLEAAQKIKLVKESYYKGELFNGPSK